MAHGVMQFDRSKTLNIDKGIIFARAATGEILVLKLMLILFSLIVVVCACTPRVELAMPSEPITGLIG